MTEKHQPAEDIPCPECSLKGRPRMLQLYQINFNEAIYWCGLKDCTYPKGHKCIIIDRNIMETCSDTENGSTDSDIEKITQLFTERARKKIKRASKVKSSFTLDSISDLDSDSDSADDIEKAFDILKGKKYINVNKNNIFIKYNKDSVDNNTQLNNSVTEITKDFVNSSVLNETVSVKLNNVQSCKVEIDQNKPNDICNSLNDMPNSTVDIQVQENVLKNPDLTFSPTKFKVMSNDEAKDINSCENLTPNSISSSILCNDILNDINISEKITKSFNIARESTGIQNIPKDIVVGKNMSSIFDAISIETDIQINGNSQHCKLSSDPVKIEIKSNDIPKNIDKSMNSIFDPCEIVTNILNNVNENHTIRSKLTSDPIKSNNVPNDTNLDGNTSPILTSTPFKFEMKHDIANNEKENVSESTNLTSDLFKTDIDNSYVPDNISLPENISRNLTSTPLKFETKNDIANNVKENVSESTNPTSDLFKTDIASSDVLNNISLPENISRNLTSTSLKIEMKKDISNNVKENVTVDTDLISDSFENELKRNDAPNDLNLHEKNPQNNTSTPLKFETKKDIPDNLKENILESTNLTFKVRDCDASNDVNLLENISQNLSSTHLKHISKKDILNDVMKNVSESIKSVPFKIENTNSDESNDINANDLISTSSKIEMNNDILNDIQENVLKSIHLTSIPCKIENNNDVSNDVNLHDNISENINSTLLKFKTDKDISNNVSKNYDLTSVPTKMEIKHSDIQDNMKLHENNSHNSTSSPKSEIKTLNNVLVNPEVSSVPLKIEIKLSDTTNLHENPSKNTNVNSAPFKIKINSDEKVNIPIQNIQNCFKNGANLETNLNSNIIKLDTSKLQKNCDITEKSSIPNSIQNNLTSIPIKIEVLNSEIINIPNNNVSENSKTNLVNNICTNIDSNVNNVSKISLNSFELPDLSQSDLDNVENKSMFNNSLELNLDDKMNLTEMINNADDLDIENMPIIFGDCEDNEKLFNISLMETSQNTSNLIPTSPRIGVGEQKMDSLTNISPIKIPINPNGLDSNNITYDNSVNPNILKLNSERFTKRDQNDSTNNQKLNSLTDSQISDDCTKHINVSLTDAQKSVSATELLYKTNILNRIKLPEDSKDKRKSKYKGTTFKKICEKFGVIETSRLIVNNSPRTKITEKQMLAMKKIKNLPGIKKICFISHKNDIPLKKNIQMPLSPEKNKKPLTPSLISAALSVSRNSIINKNNSKWKLIKPVSKAGPSRFDSFNFDDPGIRLIKPNATLVHTSPKKSNGSVVQEEKVVDSQVMNDILDLDIDKVNLDLGAGNVSNSNMDENEMDDWLSSLLN